MKFLDWLSGPKWSPPNGFYKEEPEHPVGARVRKNLGKPPLRTGVVHVGGVSWHDAPKPPKRHRCYPHSRGKVGGRWVERCACGGRRVSGFDGVSGYDGAWRERNSRKDGG